MSMMNVKAFFEKVEEDEGLQAQLKALRAETLTQINAAKDRLIQIAADTGFEFTADDLTAARGEATEQLSSDELRRVSNTQDPLDCMPGYSY